MRIRVLRAKRVRSTRFLRRWVHRLAKRARPTPIATEGLCLVSAMQATHWTHKVACVLHVPQVRTRHSLAVRLARDALPAPSERLLVRAQSAAVAAAQRERLVRRSVSVRV